MSPPRRVAVQVTRDERLVTISTRDSETGARAALELYRRGAAALAAQLLSATSDDDDWDSEAELRGSLEVHP